MMAEKKSRFSCNNNYDRVPTTIHSPCFSTPMYARHNYILGFVGHDQRLERTMESALMVMEALDGFSERLCYDIIGHSGEENDLPFTKIKSPPTNEKERLDVLKTMLAHAQV
jgi:hypothetical protein